MAGRDLRYGGGMLSGGRGSPLPFWKPARFGQDLSAVRKGAFLHGAAQRQCSTSCSRGGERQVGGQGRHDWLFAAGKGSFLRSSASYGLAFRGPRDFSN